jgi:transcription antitermination factor NusG
MSEPVDSGVSRWFALTVKPRHERAAAGALRVKGLEDLLPLYRTRRRWSDRMKELELPLFPGYVFCRFAARQRTAVLATPGVRSIVGFGRQATPVEEEEIGAIRAMIASGLPLGPWPYLRAGQRIRIEGGPLRGVEGILLEASDACRVVVSVNLLQRSVAVQVDRQAIGPAGESGSVLDPVFAWSALGAGLISGAP